MSLTQLLKAYQSADALLDVLDGVTGAVETVAAERSVYDSAYDLGLADMLAAPDGPAAIIAAHPIEITHPPASAGDVFDRLGLRPVASDLADVAVKISDDVDIVLAGRLPSREVPVGRVAIGIQVRF